MHLHNTSHTPNCPLCNVTCRLHNMCSGAHTPSHTHTQFRVPYHSHPAYFRVHPIVYKHSNTQVPLHTRPNGHPLPAMHSVTRSHTSRHTSNIPISFPLALLSLLPAPLCTHRPLFLSVFTHISIWGMHLPPKYRCSPCPWRPHLLIYTALSTWVSQAWGLEKAIHLHLQPPTALIKVLGQARGASSCIFTRSSQTQSLAPSKSWGPHHPHLGAATVQHHGQRHPRPSGSPGGGGSAGFSLPARPPLQECGICRAARRESNLPGHPTPVAEAPASVG